MFPRCFDRLPTDFFFSMKLSLPLLFDFFQLSSFTHPARRGSRGDLTHLPCPPVDINSFWCSPPRVNSPFALSRVLLLTCYFFPSALKARYLSPFDSGFRPVFSLFLQQRRSDSARSPMIGFLQRVENPALIFFFLPQRFFSLSI